MPIVKTTIELNSEIHAFLKYVKLTKGINMGFIINDAILEKYREEFERFKKAKALRNGETFEI